MVKSDHQRGDHEAIMWEERCKESSGVSLEERLVALVRRALVVDGEPQTGGLKHEWEVRTQAAGAHEPLQRLTVKRMEVEERDGGRSRVSSVSAQERAASSRGELSKERGQVAPRHG